MKVEDSEVDAIGLKLSPENTDLNTFFDNIQKPDGFTKIEDKESAMVDQVLKTSPEIYTILYQSIKNSNKENPIYKILDEQKIFDALLKKIPETLIPKDKPLKDTKRETQEKFNNKDEKILTYT